MLCSKPVMVRGQAFGCYRCLPCRIRRAKEWEARLLSEGLNHEHTSFVTLTYADQHLPPFGSLSRIDYRQFTHRLGFRYFGVGEYGSKSLRPHYHFLLFGLRADEVSRLWIAQRWGKGQVQVGDAAGGSYRYIVGYVIKSCRRVGDDRLGENCIPEFNTMSRRPAIATNVVEHLAATQDEKSVREGYDVSSVVRIGKQRFDLGRTIRGKVREAVRLPDLAHQRQLVKRDFEQRLRDCPVLSEDREVKRITQSERAEAIAKRKVSL